MFSLDDEISDIEKEINASLNNAKQLCGLEILKALENVTPVDTTEAISNWQLNWGEPIKSDRELFEYKNRERSKMFAIADAESKMLPSKELENESLNSKSVFITNNVKHIDKLDKGGSKQAPAGFVEAVVNQVFNDFIKRRG